MQIKIKGFIEATKKMIKNNKKRIIVFVISFLVFLIGFTSSSLFAIGISQNWMEHLSKYMGDETFACEVTTTNESETFRKFFSYSDDMAGREIKYNSDSYVLSRKKQTYTPAITRIGEEAVEVETILQYTTWEFDKFNFGLKTLSGAKTKNLTVDETYINLKLADELSLKSGYAINDLIGKQFLFELKNGKRNLKIVDVITNENEINLGPYFNSKMMITSFYLANNMFKHDRYIFVLRSSYLSKYYVMSYIEKTITKLNVEKYTYSSAYMRLQNNAYVEDITETKQALSQYYQTQNRFLFIPSISVPILIWVAMFFCMRFNIARKEIFFSVFASGLLYSVILIFANPKIMIEGGPIYLCTMISSLLIVLFLIYSILIYYLFEKPKKEKESLADK